MNDQLKSRYLNMTDIELKQKWNELKEFLKNIFDDNSRTDDFIAVEERYEFIEDELRNRDII